MVDTYKGVRDFYPEDQRIQKYLFATMRKTVESFGYEEYNASVLEPTELYTAKTSEEIIRDQTYTFTDRGGRSVTLRPEMTPTVSRMVAARRREFGYPLRLFCIQNFFRYERPQKGRLREFWQLNADLFGAPDADADAEAVELAYRIMTGFGATNDMFTIKVADRGLLETSFDACGLNEKQKLDYRMLLDRKNKISEAEFAEAAAEITDTDPLALILGTDQSVAEAESGVRGLIARLIERGVGNVTFDPSIVRGFDYYTGIVFEVYDTSGENKRSLFGGGRYDRLVGEYGGEQVPAVGFAIGDVIARDFLETHGLLPTLAPATALYLAPVTADDRESAARAADTLRTTGMNVALGMKHEKIGDHIKAATKLGITRFAAYGEKERASNVIEIKNLVTGEIEKKSL